MKKLMMTVAAILMFGAATVYAQDTTKTTTKKTTTTTTTQTMKGWSKVNSADVPTSLRQTLQGSQYSGWEKSTLYKNQAGDRYYIRLGEGQTAKTYNFNQAGQAVNGNGTGTGPGTGSTPE